MIGSWNTRPVFGLIAMALVGITQFLNAAPPTPVGDLPTLVTKLNGRIDYEQQKGVNVPYLVSLSDTKASDEDLKAIVATGVQSLRRIDLDGTKVTKAGVAELASLPSLSTLFLNRTSITAELARSVAQCKSLEYLNLGWTDANDAAVRELTPLAKLTFLNLNRTKVSDKAAEPISTLKSLRELWLGETEIGDAGAKKLAELPKLEILAVDRSALTDAGVESIAGLKTLKSLTLGHTNVSDSGVRSICQGLQQLEHLSLEGDLQVTDKSVDELTKLANLKTLDVSGSSVTNQGKQRLRDRRRKIKLLGD